MRGFRRAALAVVMILALLPTIPPTVQASAENVMASSAGARVIGFSRQFDARAYAAFLIDSKISFNAYYSSWWVKAPSAKEWVSIEMAALETIDRIDVVNDGQYGARAVSIFASADNTTWRQLGSWSGLTVPAGAVSRNTLRFAPTQARFLRFEFTQPNDAGWLQICELEAYRADGPPPPPQRALTDDSLTQAEATVFRDQVAYAESRNGDWNVVVRDLLTGASTSTAGAEGNQRHPSLGDRWLVWEDDRNGDLDIYGRHLASGEETRLTDAPWDEHAAIVDDQRVLYVEERADRACLRLLDLASGKETEIAIGVGSHAALDGDTVAWTSGNGTAVETVDLATGIESRFPVRATHVLARQRDVFWLTEDGGVGGTANGAPAIAASSPSDTVEPRGLADMGGRLVAAFSDGTNARLFALGTTRAWSELATAAAIDGVAASGGRAVWTGVPETDVAPEVYVYESPEPLPRAAVGPQRVEFGQVVAGRSLTKSVTIRNAGNAPLRLAAAEASGSFSANVSASGVEVAPGSTASVAVSFSPKDPGAAFGILTLLTNDPDVPVTRLPLSGTGVAAPPPSAKRGRVTFTFDDAFSTQLSLIEQLDARGVRGVFAIPSAWVGTTGRLSAEDIRGLIRNGHEIANHGSFHRFSHRTPVGQWEEQVADAQRYWSAGFGITPRTMVFPGWSYNPDILRWLRTSGFTVARSGPAVDNYLPGAGQGGSAGAANPRGGAFVMDSVNIATNNPLTYQRYIDQAKANDTWVVFTLHHSGQMDATNFGKLIDYALKADVPVVTFEEAAAAPTLAVGDSRLETIDAAVSELVGYEGPWATDTAANARLEGLGFKASGSVGAKARCTFETTAERAREVAVVAYCYRYGKDADVYLDGAKVGTLSSYGPYAINDTTPMHNYGTAQQERYRSFLLRDLAPGTHTVELRVTNPYGRTGWFCLDAIELREFDDWHAARR